MSIKNTVTVVIEYAKTQFGFLVTLNDKKHFFDCYKEVEKFIEDLKKEDFVVNINNKVQRN